LAEEPIPNRPAKIKVTAEAGKHGTTGGGHLLGDQARNSRGQGQGIAEEGMIGLSDIEDSVLPSAASSVQTIGVFWFSDLP